MVVVSQKVTKFQKGDASTINRQTLELERQGVYCVCVCVFNEGVQQEITKRCRLSWLTNSALKKAQMRGEGGVAASQPMSTAVHMEPK